MLDASSFVLNLRANCDKNIKFRIVVGRNVELYSDQLSREELGKAREALREIIQGLEGKEILWKLEVFVSKDDRKSLLKILQMMKKYGESRKIEISHCSACFWDSGAFCRNSCYFLTLKMWSGFLTKGKTQSFIKKITFKNHKSAKAKG